MISMVKRYSDKHVTMRTKYVFPNYFENQLIILIPYYKCDSLFLLAGLDDIIHSFALK